MVTVKIFLRKYKDYATKPVLQESLKEKKLAHEPTRKICGR